MRVIKHINKKEQEQVGEVQSVLEFLQKYRKTTMNDLSEVIEGYEKDFKENGETLLSRHTSLLGEITVLKP